MAILEFELGEAADEAEDGAPLLILLHGRGADRRDLLGLGPHLPSPFVLVTPQAPFPGASWGYGPGWAWYRYVTEDRVEGGTLKTSLTKLGEFLETLPGLLPFRPGPMTLGGFSQGGTMSFAFALRNPGRVAQAVNLSGFLVDDPGVEVSKETVAATRFFWGHGERDPAIPFTLAVLGREKLEEMGARLTTFDHPGGHQITQEELRALTDWLEEG